MRNISPFQSFIITLKLIQIARLCALEFTAIIETAEEGGYFAYCPEISGANGQGKTVEECRNDLIEAIALILEDPREDALEKHPFMII